MQEVASKVFKNFDSTSVTVINVSVPNTIKVLDSFRKKTSENYHERSILKKKSCRTKYFAVLPRYKNSKISKVKQRKEIKKS